MCISFWDLILVIAIIDAVVSIEMQNVKDIQ